MPGQQTSSEPFYSAMSLSSSRNQMWPSLGSSEPDELMTSPTAFSFFLINPVGLIGHDKGLSLNLPMDHICHVIMSLAGNYVMLYKEL